MSKFVVWPQGAEGEAREIEEIGFASAAVAYHQARVMGGAASAGGTHRIIVNRGHESVAFDLRVRSIVVETRHAE